MSRLGRFLGWAAPLLLCLLIYGRCLRFWFWADDFAWLSLSQSIKSWSSLWTALFQPMAQGTIRPVSERLFFLVPSRCFGLSALPFRLCILTTQLASLAVWSAVIFRMTRSRFAAILGPSLWVCGAGLAIPLSWISAYNQVLLGLTLPAALWFWLVYCETGGRRALACVWGFFLLGFGVLETNVVFPAIAITYAILFAPHRRRQTLPFFLVSALYTAVHFWAAPRTSEGPYLLTFDGGMIKTLWTYWAFALGETRFHGFPGEWRGVAGSAAVVVFSAWLLGLSLWTWFRGRREPIFFLAWFVILLLPVLPLQHHISEYYLAGPTAGLAAGAGTLTVWMWGRSRLAGAACLALCLLVCIRTLAVTHAQTHWYGRHTLAARKLVLGSVQAAALHPGKLILLTGLEDENFWGVVAERAFRLYGIPARLAPQDIPPTVLKAPPGEVSEFLLPEGPARFALLHGLAVVYDASGDRLRNVTGPTSMAALLSWRDFPPSRIEAGSSLYDGYFGPGWYPAEGHVRWMQQRGVLYLSVPLHARGRLLLEFTGNPVLLGPEPAGLQIQINGQPLGYGEIPSPARPTRWTFPLPALAPQTVVEVALQVSRAGPAPRDSRTLGLALAIAEIF